MSDQGVLALETARWGAILKYGDAAEALGAAAEPAVVPIALRRRMPELALSVVRCGWALVQEAPESEIVHSSRFGDLDSTVKLLTDLATRTPLSPTTFSSSVHNAPAGLLGLCLGAPASHTAVAAGRSSLAAGLTEAYARLCSGEADAVVLIHADAALPAVYGNYDESGPGVCLGMRLTLPRDVGAQAVDVGLGRDGAAAVVRALAGGARRLRFSPPAQRAVEKRLAA
jgi:hypothetical protein